MGSEQRESSPVNISNRVSQQWIQAAEAVVDWYGAMLKLAFGLGRLSNGYDPQRVVTSPPPPRAEEESLPAVPLQSMPNAPLKLQSKRRKAPSAANSRSRSSRVVPSVRRSRRAA
jgi:hypothetical protein